MRRHTIPRPPVKAFVTLTPAPDATIHLGYPTGEWHGHVECAYDEPTRAFITTVPAREVMALHESRSDRLCPDCLGDLDDTAVAAHGQTPDRSAPVIPDPPTREYTFDVPAILTVHVRAPGPRRGLTRIAAALETGVVLDEERGGVVLHQLGPVPGRPPELVFVDGGEPDDRLLAEARRGSLEQGWFGDRDDRDVRLVSETAGHYDAHGYQLVRFYRTGETTWRVTVRRDPYPSQSRAVVELLNRNLEWTTIAESPPATWHESLSLYGEKGTGKNPRPGFDAARAMTADLLALARAITDL